MADKIASMMAAGWISIPEVKWDAMKARAARADKLKVLLDELLDVALITGDLPAIRETARKVHLELGDAAPSSEGDDVSSSEN